MLWLLQIAKSVTFYFVPTLLLAEFRVSALVYLQVFVLSVVGALSALTDSASRLRLQSFCAP